MAPSRPISSAGVHWHSSYHLAARGLPVPYRFSLVEGNRAHRELFVQAILSARTTLIVVSPWVVGHAFTPYVRSLFQAAILRGVTVYLAWGYGQKLVRDERKEKQLLYDLRKRLRGRDRRRLVISQLQTHEKVLICDDKFCVWGSYNWLSNPGEQIPRRETSSYSEDPAHIQLWKRRVSSCFRTEDCFSPETLRSLLDAFREDG